MNIIRDGVILIAYTFAVILAYVFLSEPFAVMVSNIAAASDVGMMTVVKNEVFTVFSICCAMAVFIPIIVFIWLAFTTRNEEYLY